MGNTYYEGKLYKETNNFLIYSSYTDLDYIGFLSSHLEEYYKIIKKSLEYNLKKKIHINIYKNVKEFHCAMGIPNAPDWFRACGDDSIHIVPKEYFNDIPIENVIAHELVHIVLHNISSDIPKWLDEGIASYIAAVCYEDIRGKTYTKKVINNNLYNGKIPNIIELSSDLTKFGDNNGYEYSYTFIEFLIDIYGYDKLNMLIRDVTNFENVFKMDYIDAYNSWINYLKEKYI